MASKKSAQAANVGWKLGSQIGEGGQGEVFLAVRASEPDGPNYAFKFLNDKGSSKARDRFRQELKALTSVSHPGIVNVVQYAQPEDSFQYYVMEYVDGLESLRKRMDRHTNPFFKDPLKAVDGFIQIVEALAACELRHIVHRDLSPANVLVAKAGRIMLIDFGLCHIDDDTIITLTDEAVGTPHYRAPECSGYSPQQPDIRADLYSAGKILWSMITNKAAFDREPPVFNGQSLAKLFPDLPKSWHLHHIFEGTVRHDAHKRLANTTAALETARHVRRLMLEGFKPLEQLADTLCPVCGIGRHGTSAGLHDYANELEALYKSMALFRGDCSLCPYCFHVSFAAYEALAKRLEGRKKLV